ncbi:MAG: NlpC/P60 family protein [Oscillospiraceae bacterium]|nr:NlpC/P60 family protein [Oscillospiraceae bacterium]
MNENEWQLFSVPANLTEGLPDDRRAVVQTALSLLGRVPYFWGGKSSAIGWDSRWGIPAEVTAPGSLTTGTIRPYGLDCSGFVDWVFYNSLDCLISHGGNSYTQYAHCAPISWSQALPGDLAFYPDNSHVGVFVGTGRAGEALVIHCAAFQNNVVLTGRKGFTSMGRPDIYESFRCKDVSRKSCR